MSPSRDDNLAIRPNYERLRSLCVASDIGEDPAVAAEGRVEGSVWSVAKKRPARPASLARKTTATLPRDDYLRVRLDSDGMGLTFTNLSIPRSHLAIPAESGIESAVPVVAPDDKTVRISRPMPSRPSSAPGLACFFDTARGDTAPVFREGC